MVDQKAGKLDRIFNSTIGLPQQVIWRIIRALEDDKIDLFSEEGLADFALVPGAGVFDDHKNDVMPDYMAETLGWGDSLGAQLGAAIMSDPLTYLTGGLTAAAKVGRHTQKALRVTSMRKGIQAAATKAGTTVGEVLETMPIGDLGSHLDEALKGTNNAKQARKLRRAQRTLSGDLPKATGTLSAETPVAEALKMTTQRQIAVGLPGLATFGAKYDVKPGYSSWWTVFTEGTAKGGKALARAATSNHLVGNVPGYGRVLKTAAGLTSPLRHAAIGWKVGGEPLAAVAHASEQMTEAELKAFGTWTNSETGAADVIPQLLGLNEKSKGKAKERIIASFTKNVSEGMEYEDAFGRALRKHGVGSQSETGAALWGRFTGRGSDSTFFPKWRSGQDGVRAIDSALDNAVANWRKASDMSASGKFNLSPKLTKHGKLARIYKGERKELGPALSALSGLAYESARRTRAYVTEAFLTGSPSQHGAKATARLSDDAARNNDQAEELAEAWMQAKADLVKLDGHTLTEPDINAMFGKFIQLEGLPGEFEGLRKIALSSREEAPRAAETLGNLSERHRRVLGTFEKVLKAEGGIGDPAIRQKLLDVFGDEVFPFLEREGKQSLRATFDKINTPTREVTEVLSRAQTTLMRRKPNKHVIRGAHVDKQVGGFSTEEQVLEGLVGKQAGYLPTETVRGAVERIEEVGRRPMRAEEVIGAAEKMPAVAQFAERNGITIEEATSVLLRKSRKGATGRQAKATELVTEGLWDSERTRWSANQAAGELERYGLALEVSEDGLLRLRSSKVTDATLRRSYGLKQSGYRTISEAMAHARSWLARNAKYTGKFGPKALPTEVTKLIPTKEIDDVFSLLTSDELLTLRGKNRVYDDLLIPDELRADQARLKELLERRTNPEHPYHEAGPIVPEQQVRVTDPSPPRTGDDMFVSLNANGFEVTEAEFSEHALHYSYGRFLTHELQTAVKRSAEYNAPLHLDPQVLMDLEEHLKESGRMVVDMALDQLPPEFKEMWRRTRLFQERSLEEAQRAGIWTSGSPIGYLPRLLTGESRAKIASIIGDIENSDGALLERLGVKQSQRFGRSLDHLSQDDIQELYAEVDRVSRTKGTDPRYTVWAEQIEQEMVNSGLRITGLPGASTPYTGKKLVDDPFLALIQRFTNLQQDASLEQYWDNILDVGSDVPGESSMMGGKIVGVIDDTGNTHTHAKPKTYPVRSIKRTTKDGGSEIIEATEEGGKLEQTPVSLVLEDKHGNRHIIHSNMLHETGFGLLPLGAAGDANEMGFVPTVAKSFVNAARRSDLTNNLLEGSFDSGKAYELVGQHAVFGAKNLVVSGVNAAKQLHKVEQPALRTFDSVNYIVKAFQTIYRLPFHVANLASGVFQAMLAGASPKDVFAGYMDALRFMSGHNPELGRATEMMMDMIGIDPPKTGGVRSLLSGKRPGIQKTARLAGDGSLGRFGDEIAAEDFDLIEDIMYDLGDGTSVNVGEVLSEAGDSELYGTLASSLVRGSQTVGENLRRIKFLSLDPKAGNRIVGAGRRGLEKMRNVAENSEVLNRTATVLALIRSGHPVKRAIQIAKQAHVPYEKLTPFEKGVMKRFSVYYSFPRHYLPWAWARFAENPTTLARLGHTIRDQKLLYTQEGRPTLPIGDMRIDVGRLNANMEAAGILGAFFDRLVMPAAETLMPGVSDVDPRDLVRAQSDAGLTSVGGVAGALLGTDSFLPTGDRSGPGTADFWGEAVNMTWPIKMVARLAGKTVSGSDSPYVEDKTPIEAWLTDPVVGVGLRKVRPDHELQLAKMAYQREIRKLQLRAAATEDPAVRKRYLGHIEILTGSLVQIAGDVSQKQD